MGRAPCCSKVGLNRGPWTPEEDTLLSKYIEAHGEGNWRALPKAAGLLRCGKSCRLRWVNYLRPNVKRGNISEDEENLIIMLHALLGNRWSLIAARMPGRTDNEIKNYWNTHLSKKLASRGLDPKTHKPIKPAATPTKSEAPQKDSDCEEPQEAWETTMDMDTISYSTGSCEELQDYRPVKKQSPVLSPLKKQEIEIRKDNIKDKNKGHKFDCPSPSSVLNMYSPAASGSNCDSPSSTRSVSISKSNSLSSLSSESKPAVIQDTTQVFSKNDHAMLEFIDEFLSKDAEIEQAPDLFRDDGGASEFWDSLGKIELPSITQSHLWDGLNEFVPPGSVQTPDIDDNILINHSAPAHFIQDNELLFCS